VTFRVYTHPEIDPDFIQPSEENIMVFFKYVQGLLKASSESGQDLAEYAVFLGLIALVVLVSITILGTNISQIFTFLATAVEGWL
jgi:Flp pilus assembly pilin Flp